MFEIRDSAKSLKSAANQVEVYCAVATKRSGRQTASSWSGLAEATRVADDYIARGWSDVHLCRQYVCGAVAM